MSPSAVETERADELPLARIRAGSSAPAIECGCADRAMTSLALCTLTNMRSGDPAQQHPAGADAARA